GTTHSPGMKGGSLFHHPGFFAGRGDQGTTSNPPVARDFERPGTWADHRANREQPTCEPRHQPNQEPASAASVSRTFPGFGHQPGTDGDLDTTRSGWRADAF